MKISFLGFKKISWKLTIIYALIFSLVLILLNAAILYGVKYFLVQQSIKQVDSISNSIIEKIKGSPNEQTNISDPELLSEAQSNAEINIRITNPDGKIINESDNIDIDKKSVKLHLNRTMEVGAAGAHLVIRNSEVLSDGKVKAYL